MQQPQKFIVSGFNGLRVYCKITSFTKYGASEPNYSISFGGKNTFCFTSSIENPEICYIDRVEYNAPCVVNGELKERGGTVELVKLALWTIMQKFPQIKKFTFKDNSYIYCEKGSKTAKMSLSYDSMLKYNKTWYQRHFGAELHRETTVDFEKMLSIFDQPLADFDYIVTKLDALRPFKAAYESAPEQLDVPDDQMPCMAHTPRAFINALRGPNYCFDVGKWLEQYMTVINVGLFADNWFIRRENVMEPPNYQIVETQNSIRGGYRGTRKRRNFSLIVHNSCGGYDN
jgi:hypothetical protein